MTRNTGRPYRAIPGPSVMPDSVLREMHRAAPDIYGVELHILTEDLIPGLMRVARTRNHVAMYIGNGHAAWEAGLVNTVAPGDTVLVLCTGRFGHSWAEMAQDLGIETQILDFGKQAPVDLGQLEQALRGDTHRTIKAVLATHVDTATSIRNDIKGIRETLDAADHPALLMIDCIASLACDTFEMDVWGVDVMLAASQKGLMTPPGMAFVFFNDRAVETRATMPRISRYWDWRPRAEPEQFYQYFCGTAPTHHLYGLQEALYLIHSEGMKHIWARHARLARAIWAAVETWGQGGDLALNVADPAYRSHAVTSLSLPTPQASNLREWVEHNTGVTLGIGLGMAEPDSYASHGLFRMGHMGHVNGHMIMGMLGAVQAGLIALDIPHGSGALEAAARELDPNPAAPRSG